MKIEEKYTVNWNVKEITCNTFFAGLFKDFDSLKDALDYIDSRQCPSEYSSVFDMDPANWDVQIVYSYTKEEGGKLVEHKTRTLPYKNWKEEYDNRRFNFDIYC